jgi:hypothetical protein
VKNRWSRSQIDGEEDRSLRQTREKAVVPGGITTSSLTVSLVE